MTAQIHTIIRENWLTRKVDSSAAAMATLATLALLFGGLVYWNNTWQAEQWMSATPQAVLGRHELWRAWTTLFVHADARHLLSNSLLFFILGLFLNGYFGIFVFPVLAFFMGGLTNLIVLRQMPEATELIGVSGVVFWMGGFWLVLYFMIDRRKSILQRALRAMGVGLALFMPAEAFDPSISYSSHLFGFFSGVICAGIYFIFKRHKFRSAEVSEMIVDEDERLRPESPI